MMFKKKLLASAMATALVSGAMLSGGAQAVRMSETETGQLLLGNMYLARSSDYSNTVVKVINTSTTDAVKAKIVFRSKKHSDECKDLILYLTPGDVAYMTVRLDAAGQPEIWTNDDSILASRMSDGTAVFASQSDKLGKDGQTFAMVAPRTEPSQDTCAQGHIEVIGMYAVTGTVTGLSSGAPNVTIAMPMKKHDLIRVFDTPKPTLNAALNNITNDGATRGGADYSSRVQLMGSTVIANTTDRLMDNMVAIREGVNARTGATTTYLVTNPNYDESVGAETPIGQGYGDVTRGSLVADMAWDIEGALTTPKLHNLFAVGGTNHEVTFPTKYRHIISGRYSGTGATYDAPFQTKGEMQYGVTTWDNQENSAPGVTTALCVASPCTVPTVAGSFLIHEVNFEALGAGWNLNGSDSGWFRMVFTNRTGVDNLGFNWATSAIGAPAIGYAHYYKTGLTQSVVSKMGR